MYKLYEMGNKTDCLYVAENAEQALTFVRRYVKNLHPQGYRIDAYFLRQQWIRVDAEHFPGMGNTYDFIAAIVDERY